MSDAQERTEQATEKHLREVRRKGRLGRSQDLPSWAALAVAALTLPLVIEHGAQAAMTQLLRAGDVIASPDPGAAVGALRGAFASVLPTLGTLLAVVVVTVIATSAVQGGIRFRAFSLKTEHLDLGKGLAHLFGAQSLWQGLKALLKSLGVGLAVWAAVRMLQPELLDSGIRSTASLIGVAENAVTWVLIAAIAAGLVIAAFDVLVVLRRNRKQTRMTKREVRDEMKSSEGDPLVRQQRRSRHLAATRGSMVAAVEAASVVLVNPTHVAVALRYEPGASAPRVVAKGQGETAARIRAAAARHRVPMVRDVPLARAINAQVALGREIPPELYTPVAQVLAFVQLLKARGAASGVRDNPHASSPTFGES